MITTWLAIFGASALVMTATFLWQRRTRNAGWVDVVWSYLMGAAAVAYALRGEGEVTLRVLLAVLAGTWALRLGTHLAVRVAGEPEDGRYAHLRAHWNDDQRRFFAFFMAQALLVALLSLPYAAVAANPNFDPRWVALGVALWLAGLGGEAIADRQLAAFRADPANRGRVCERGLWGWSRHPNYFFEWLHWFGYVAFAVGSPLFGLSLLGPVLMGLSLVFLTGIPYVEQQSLRSRGEAYRDYQRRVSAFVPWPPRKDSTPA